MVSQQQSYILPRTVRCVITHGRRSKPAPGNISAMIVSSISMYNVVFRGISSTSKTQHLCNLILDRAGIGLRSSPVHSDARKKLNHFPATSSQITVLSCNRRIVLLSRPSDLSRTNPNREHKSEETSLTNAMAMRNSISGRGFKQP